MRRIRRAGLLWSLLLSAALHCVLVARLQRADTTPARDAPSAVELTFVENRRADAIEDHERAAPSVAPDRTVLPPTREAAPRKPRAPDQAPAPSIPTEPETREQRTETTHGPTFDLSPAAAAATMAAELARAPQRPRCESAAEADAASPADCDVPPPDTRAAQRLQEHVERAASDIPHLERRAPPRLRRDTNGNHHYKGVGFSALIRKDGSVDFTDNADVAVAPIPIGGIFDLTDAMDPNVYSAEKRRFLEETEALRTRLASEDRQRVMSQGRLRLRGKLERILADDGLSPVQKRIAVFELWDDCAGDEVGREAQRLVELFVRDRMPSASSLGYGDAELAELNVRRVSPRPFAPYEG